VLRTCAANAVPLGMCDLRPQYSMRWAGSATRVGAESVGLLEVEAYGPSERTHGVEGRPRQHTEHCDHSRHYVEPNEGHASSGSIHGLGTGQTERPILRQSDGPGLADAIGDSWAVRAARPARYSATTRSVSS
jgi:hypothetical protein